jgi:uridine phosphorylase
VTEPHAGAPARLGPDDTLTLLQVPVAGLAPRVLVVGDPARAATAAGRLEDARQVGANREYVTYTGTYRGTAVSVASHGVGSGGAAICFEELCRGGAAVIVRAGTAGGLAESVRDGDLVVATAAVRGEGVTPRIVPLGYPAVADAELTMALWAAAGAAGLTAHAGVVLTSDLFYPHPVLGDDLALWARARCVAVEMELAALLVITGQHGVRAGGVFAIDGNPLAAQDADMSGYQPFREVVARAVAVTLDVALDALVAVG